MIDRFLIRFFGVIDNFFYWLTAPRCKCKTKKEPEEKRTYTKLKDHGTDISFENEVKKWEIPNLSKCF